MLESARFEFEDQAGNEMADADINGDTTHVVTAVFVSRDEVGNLVFTLRVTPADSAEKYHGVPATPR